MNLILQAIKSLFRKLNVDVERAQETANEALTTANTLPDWNQTDETAADYIKNRTHYSENLYGVLLSNTVETSAWDDMWACFDIETTFVPEIGKEYTVIWDGDSYTVTCIQDEAGRILGDENGYYGYIGDLPFQLLFFYDGTMSVYTSSEGAHTYEVLGAKEIVHKLDAKYLPDDAAKILDVNNLQSEISDSLDNLDSRKMNVDNPIGTGSFSMNSAANYVAGDYSSTLGNLNKAYGECSHADGMGTVASKDAQITEGKYNIVEPKYYEVHTENNYIDGNQYAYISTEYTFDVATGIYTLVSPRNVMLKNQGAGFYACLSGQQGNVIYYRSSNMTMTGDSNVSIYVDTYTSALLENEDIYSHIVGNGASDTARSNAHTLDWQGNAWYSGDVYVGSTSGVNKDEGSKKLATEEKVTELSIVQPTVAEVGQMFMTSAVDESGRVTEVEAINVADADDALDLLAEMEVVSPVATSTGAIYATSDGKVYSY